MIATISKKMNVFLLLAAVAQCSSVMAMDAPVSVEEGSSAPKSKTGSVFSMPEGFDFARRWNNAKNTVSGSYPYNGALSEFQARFVGGVTMFGLGALSLFVAKTSEHAQDQKVLAALAAMPLVIGGALYKLAQRYNPKTQIENQNKAIHNQIQNPYLKDLFVGKSVVKLDSNEAAYEHILAHVSSPTNFPLLTANEEIYALEQEVSKLQARNESMKILAKISGDETSDRRADILDSVSKETKKLRFAVNERLSHEDYAPVLNAATKDKEFMASQSWGSWIGSGISRIGNFATMGLFVLALNNK